MAHRVRIVDVDISCSLPEVNAAPLLLLFEGLIYQAHCLNALSLLGRKVLPIFKTAVNPLCLGTLAAEIHIDWKGKAFLRAKLAEIQGLYLFQGRSHVFDFHNFRATDIG